jgi:hypothetical protein
MRPEEKPMARSKTETQSRAPADSFPGLHRQLVVHRSPPRRGTKPRRHRLAVATSIHQVFDVYIPQGLRKLGATEKFIQRITSFCEGATAYQGGEGLWQGESEAVQVVRISIEVVDCEGKVIFDIDAVREGVRDAAQQLIVDLAGEGHVEHAIFFNDWTTRATLIRRV